MGQRIFIIEDDANLLAALTAQFSAAGMEVIGNEACGNIETVMNQLILSEPEFVILDLVLPQIDGFHLLKTIKENHEAIPAPVFVFSDFSEADAKERCENLGADFYFIKADFNAEEFATKVKNIISNRQKINNQNQSSKNII